MDSPYELQRLVIVATFSTPWEAQVAQARLSAEGLHSLIADEHVIRMVALANAVGGIRLKVREQDAAAAVEVLRRLAPLPEIYLVNHDPEGQPNAWDEGADAESWAVGGEGSPRCPACASDELRVERSSRLLLGVLPLSRWAYRCGACGILWKPDEVEGGRRLEPALPGFAAPAPAPAAEAAAGNPPLITVARFATPWEAHLARTLLESEGMRCCVREERMPAVHLLSAEPAAFNRLEVHQADAQRAGELLARVCSYPSRVAAPDAEAELEAAPELDAK